MNFDFYKLQAAGNDLILVDFSKDPVPPPEYLSEISEDICRRDYGIGGNGFIVVTELSNNWISASFIDPSGKFPPASFDAALCLSRYVFDTGLTGKDDFLLSINNKQYSIGIIDSNNFRISIGCPMDSEGNVLIENPDASFIKTVSAEGREYPVTSVRIGKEGIVIFTEACSISRLKEKADEILKSAGIPSQSRLIFATVNSRDELVVHIRNSRGDDFTSSCAIAASAAVVNGLLDRNAAVFHKQGKFYFQWLHPSNEILMTGSADYIFTGSMFIDGI